MFCNVGVDSVCKDPEGELHMQAAAMYMQERIEALRRDIDKHGKVKAKKGQQAQPVAKVNPCSAFCVQILVVLFGSKHFPRRGLHAFAHRNAFCPFMLWSTKQCSHVVIQTLERFAIQTLNPEP